jgi:acetyltransferase-like isoleucine patch superfamily enzyme
MRRSAAALATSAARHSAAIAPGARFLSGGSVSNIAGRPERISVGTGSRIAGQLLVFRHGGTIRIGEWCYVGEGSRVWSASRIDIGNRVLISHGVNVHDCDSHSRDAEARHRQFRAIAVSGHPQEIEDIDSRPIEIEDDVWIGFNAIVLKGSRIGARTIVAAGSIVMGDVAPDSLYIGTEIRRAIDANDRRK